MKKSVRVSVPASSGNIGPGYDVLGLALTLRNELKVRVLKNRSGKPQIKIQGEGVQKLSGDKNNLVYRAFASVFKKAKRPVPTVEMECRNRIPLARGLGSSSAAVLSGVLVANKILRNRYSKDECLTMATKFEGHPDNVAPALYGGVRASGIEKGQVVSLDWPVPRCRMVVAVPSFELSTKKARAVLPKTVSVKDAVFNLSAVSLMPAIFFENRLHELKHVLNDRVHEPYRAKLIPGFHQVKKGALKAGAFGVILSGAGPTMLSFVSSAKAKRVGRAMKYAFLKKRIQCKIMNLSVDKKGAIVR